MKHKLQLESILQKSFDITYFQLNIWFLVDPLPGYSSNTLPTKRCSLFAVERNID